MKTLHPWDQWAREVQEGVQKYPFGHNVTMKCPVCYENTLSAIKDADGAARWHCWRATCGYKGSRNSRGTGGLHQARNVPKEFEPKPYPFLKVCTADRFWPNHWRHPDGEEVLGCTAFDGTELGHISRQKHEDGTKTVRTWRTVNRAFYHAPYPGRPLTDSLWIVEDIFSARSLAFARRRSVALLGTTPSDRFYKEELLPAVKRYGITRLLVALDPGAEAQADSIRRRFRDREGLNAIVVPLEKDIKDMGETRLTQLLEYYDDPSTNSPRSSASESQLV